MLKAVVRKWRTVASLLQQEWKKNTTGKAANNARILSEEIYRKT